MRGPVLSGVGMGGGGVKSSAAGAWPVTTPTSRPARSRTRPAPPVMSRIATGDRPSDGTATVARGVLPRLSASDSRRGSWPSKRSPGERFARRGPSASASRRTPASRCAGRPAARVRACARGLRAAATPACPRRAAVVRDRKALRPPWAARDRWRAAGAATRRGLFLAGRAPAPGRGRRSARWRRPDDRGFRRTVRGGGPPREGWAPAADGGLTAAGGGRAGAWLLTPGGCVPVAVGGVVCGGVVVAGGVVVLGGVLTGGVVTGGVVTGGGP